MARLINRAGRVVTVSEDRVQTLLGQGFKPAPATPAAGTAGTAEHYATLKAQEVLAAVEAGEYTPEMALTFEEARDAPRKTVLEALRPPETQDPPAENPEGDAPTGDPEGDQKGE